MQILSFDFGTKKIGIAVGQTITMSSSPLTVLFPIYPKPWCVVPVDQAYL